MPYDDYPLPILWHSKILRVQKLNFDGVSEVPQFLNDLIEILPISVEHSANILGDHQIRRYLFHGRKECREAIPRVLISLLGSANAKRLTRRSADYHVGLSGKVKIPGQIYFKAIAAEV